MLNESELASIMARPDLPQIAFNLRSNQVSWRSIQREGFDLSDSERQTKLVYTFGKPEFNVPISDKELTSTASKPTNE